MRKLYLDILYVLSLILVTIRTGRAGWKDLGKLWYVRTVYIPQSFGFGLDFEYVSRDDFELAMDLGPVTAAIGRDFVS